MPGSRRTWFRSFRDRFQPLGVHVVQQVRHLGPARFPAGTRPRDVLRITFRSLPAGQSLNQVPDFRPEGFLNILQCHRGVFHRVVKQGRDRQGRVGPETSRNADGVADVGVSPAVVLALVRPFSASA